MGTSNRRWLITTIIGAILIFVLGFAICSIARQPKNGIVIDNFHEVIADEYRLYVRAENGDHYYIVDVRTFNNSNIGEEIELNDAEKD